MIRLTSLINKDLNRCMRNFLGRTDDEKKTRLVQQKIHLFEARKRGNLSKIKIITVYQIKKP